MLFHGGAGGALAPFALFLTGVAWLGLSGAPDERGFWPILMAALALGVILARDRAAYSEAVLAGMSRRIVLLMVMAWLTAGVFAVLLRASGLVDSLVWASQWANLEGAAFVIVAFAICALVSTATGTSLGTILLCGPLLYPAGAGLGAEPVILMGAILGGATFGDNISPVSDTTIASASTQGADLGGVVRSRLRYALPAAAAAGIAYYLLGGAAPASATPAATTASIGPGALPMLLAPALVIGMLLRRRHLLESLLLGALAAAVLGVVLGRMEPADLLHIDRAAFGARGLVVEGIERGIGISIFTLFLAGLVAGLEASGLLDRLGGEEMGRVHSRRGAEWWIFGVVSAAVLLTTHAVVAILMVGNVTRRLGERFGIGAYRRSNLLDVTVCTYPFLLPYFIPTILAASMTADAGDMPRLSPLAVGLANFHSWALLVMVLVAIVSGFGSRDAEADAA